MFYTLRHTTDEETIARTFAGVEGFRSKKPDDLLQLTGTVHLGGLGNYNSIEITVKDSHCVLPKDRLAKEVAELGCIGEKVLKHPVAIDLRIVKQDATTVLHLQKGSLD